MALKRKPTEDGDAEKPSKKAKTGNKADEEDAEEEVTAAIEPKTKHEWELVDGNAEPPSINVKDATKLAFELQKKTTGRRESFRFRIPAKDFDWTDTTQIQSLQNWRRQILRRYGFPYNRNVKRWQEKEMAFLELFLQMLKTRVQSGEKLRRPTMGEITDHFNNFFGERTSTGEKGKKPPQGEGRPEDSISSKLKHAPLDKLWKATKESCSTAKGLPLYLPTITEDTLRKFIAKNKATSSSTKDTSSSHGPWKERLLPHRANKGTATSDPPRDEFQGAYISATMNDGESPTSVIEHPSGGRPVSHHVIQSETATLPTPSEQIEEMIEDNWFIPGILLSTVTEEETDDNPRTLKDSWMKQAVEDFDSRWERKDFGFLDPERKDLRPQWYEDRETEWRRTRPQPKTKQKGKSKPERSTLALEVRKLGAQNVNALLSLALCPPVGYGGDINALEGSTALTSFEMALVKENQRTLTTHDRNFMAKAPKKLAK